ncbi:ThiF family adenylyltransferase [Ruminococcus sp.]|uniref:tRNA threonylcarbamoyladenosine dehydratase n=1 Tax=Ruminococcus sp. TaxID=41978 RepID=UPI00388E8ED8
MINEFSRTELLLGADGMKKLKQARVAVFGIGGVGGYAVEALARSGVGALDLIDHDVISLTNLNRQIIALHSTVGQPKVEVAAARIADINPGCTVRTYRTFYTPDTAAQFDFSLYDYIIDAIDTVTGKLALVMQAKAAATPIISSMGTGNKLDPTALEVADLADTTFCPLARIMRKELRRRGIEHLKVVYSREEAITPRGESEEPSPGRRSIPGSTAFVPSAAGLILAGEVIKDIIQRE